MTRPVALLGLAAAASLAACAPSAELAPARRVMMQPRDDGTGALYKVCVATNGKLESLEVVRTFAH